MSSALVHHTVPEETESPRPPHVRKESWGAGEQQTTSRRGNKLFLLLVLSGDKANERRDRNPVIPCLQDKTLDGLFAQSHLLSRRTSSTAHHEPAP